MIHGLGTIVLSLLILGWVEIHPSLAQTPGEYRQRGLDYRNQGQLPEAIEALDQAVELEPENLSGRVLLGWTLHLAGEERRAAAILEEIAGEIRFTWKPSMPWALFIWFKVNFGQRRQPIPGLVC